MPDESCRKCGGLLLDYSICAKCRASIQYICRICGRKTLERIHDSICFRKDELDAPKIPQNIVESMKIDNLYELDLSNKKNIIKIKKK